MVKIEGIFEFPPIIDLVVLRLLVGSVGLISMAVALFGVTGFFDGKDVDPTAKVLPTTTVSPTDSTPTDPAPTTTSPTPTSTATATRNPSPTPTRHTTGGTTGGTDGGSSGGPDPDPPVDPAARQLRHGTLVVRSYVAVNLDSTAADWGAFKGSWDNLRNLEWDGDPTSMSIDNFPDSTAVLPSTAPSDFTACSIAKGGDPTTGSGLHAGQRFCVRTRKGHLVLLKVKKVVPGDYGSLTLDATVWHG
jgi:hypothetical protein